MSMDTTTFISLFHHEEQAKGVVADLVAAGVPPTVIYTLDKRAGDTADAGRFRVTLEELKVPARDTDHMLEEIGKGAILIAVAFGSDFTDKIEGIFQRHAAVKIDETVIGDGVELDAAGDALNAHGNTLDDDGRIVERPIVAHTAETPRKQV